MYMQKFKLGIYEGYGTTEASPFISCNVPSQTKDGSVGVIFPGMQYKLEPVEGITDGGELLVKGPNMMKGYLLYEEGFKPLADWYHTGDIVSIDEEGFIHIKARLKRFAKVAGEMVSLNLAESVAIACIGSPEVAAVAVGDKRKGEQIVICTTMADVSIKQLRDHIAAEQLSPLLVPSKIIQIPSIPLLGSGKTDYVGLTAKVKAQLEPGGTP
jgi:acyl-[acyl-carrier-protein]-phospholipid O-acyltransferase/long-chain-fatty-acid--[acyl-carrier-protein] ligase